MLRLLPLAAGNTGRVVLAATLVVLASCSRREETPPVAAVDAEPRIVSLSPAVSRTLVDLGLADRIVGRSRYCDFLAPDVPVVGDLLHANYERLIELAPTHVLVQTPATGIDTHLVELGRRHGWRVGQWTSLDGVNDIERLVRDLPPLLYAPGSRGLTETTRRSAALLNDLAVALRPPSPADGPAWSGPTLLVYATEPVGVFGRGTYLDEVLARLGARNAVEADGWIQLTLEDVTHLDPGAIIVVRPGADRVAGAAAAAGSLATLPVTAVREGRIGLLTHADALRPCTGIIGLADELRAVLRALGRPAADTS